MNHDLLNDEHLNTVTGGDKAPGGHSSGTNSGHGNGTGGGDGLGWLRNMIRAVDKALRF